MRFIHISTRTTPNFKYKIKLQKIRRCIIAKKEKYVLVLPIDTKRTIGPREKTGKHNINNNTKCCHKATTCNQQQKDKRSLNKKLPIIWRTTKNYGDILYKIVLLQPTAISKNIIIISQDAKNYIVRLSIPMKDVEPKQTMPRYGQTNRTDIQYITGTIVE